VVTPLDSSFRDPSGFVFKRDGVIFRQIHKSYEAQYEHLMSSGLYDQLVSRKLLVPHEEVAGQGLSIENVYKIIKPQQIPYVSYPYEWCFSQLKDAALCTIEIQKLAIDYGMVLKDASAYNVQFIGSQCIFIDSLSFDFYSEGEPWVAYKQFCQHFVAPLSLMSKKDIRLSQLLRIYIDGLPLDLVSRLLPKTSWLNYSLLTHIHLHSKTQQAFANVAASEKPKINSRKISKFSYKALMESIGSCVQNQKLKSSDTEWGEYYSDTNYIEDSMRNKEKMVLEFLRAIPTRTSILHYLGSNNGHFSRVAAEAGFHVISQDIDPIAVEKNYRQAKSDRVNNILPLLQDLTNPSNDMGWALTERDSFLRRCEGVAVMALALIHHLAISNNVPLSKQSEFFATFADHLLIEFVPKEDSQVRRLLATRKDIFTEYSEAGFERAFKARFNILRKESIEGSHRKLYLLERAI
jgi:hypothetical protein